MPSGSIRVTAASLYSFPLTVLKSSPRAADAKDRIKNVRTVVLIRARLGLGFVLIFGILWSRRIPKAISQRHTGSLGWTGKTIIVAVTSNGHVVCKGSAGWEACSTRQARCLSYVSRLAYGVTVAN